MHPPFSEDLFRLFADNTSDHAFIVLDPDGRILHWSRGAEYLLGWREAEVRGRDASLFFTPEDRAAGVPEAEMAEARAHGRSADIRWHLKKDGARIFVDGVMNSWLDADGKLIGYGKIFREAYAGFQRRLTEVTAVLANERTFLATVLEEVEDAIIACDRNGSLTFFNRAGQEFHGSVDLAVAPERWAEHFSLFHQDGETLLTMAEVPLMRALRGEQLREVEIAIVSTSGRRRNVLVSGGPLMTEGGRQLGAVVSVHDITARRQAEINRQHAAREQIRREEAEGLAQRIRENEERVRLASDAAELGIWTWDVQTHVASWDNDRMYDIFGVPRSSSALGPVAFYADIIHPDDVAAYKRTLAACLESGKRFYFEGRFRHQPDGELRWFELTGLLHQSEVGLPLKIIGTAADVTARKQAQAALIDAKARMESVLTTGEIATWIYDLRTERITVDHDMAYLFGLSEADATNGSIHSYLDAVHPDDRVYVAEQMREAIVNRTMFRADYRVRSTDGAERAVIARGRPEYDSDGTPLRLPGVLIDVTRQKQIENALSISQERYRSLFESIDEGFCLIEVIFDANGKAVDYRFLETNPAFEKHTGLHDAQGKTILELAPGQDEHWFEIYGRAVRSGEPMRFINKSTPLGRWYDVYTSRFGEPGSNQVAILFSDITEQKKADENLQRAVAELAEANRRQTEFLATLAHELRNPLAPLRNAVHILRHAQQDAALATRVHEMMERQIEHIVRLVDDLMEVSRISSGKIELRRAPVDLATVLKSAVEASRPLIDGAHHALDFALPDEPLPLDADAVRLTQVFVNLLNNAAKFTEEGGRIELTARREGAQVRASVRDSGLGIDADMLPQVFDMFTQARRGTGRAQDGLGIGLSLVKSLVAMHDGQVEAKSEGIGCGSEFIVRLPLARHPVAEAAPAPPALAAPADGSSPRPRVL
ncbi:MAG TPA: PAS domain S-box protein, partial [Oxalicibacterium sp.]|nr:PAS domain S-box protein [Oxalicibacterium sp.]